MDYDFSNVSLRGRISYGIMCAERYALNKFPNREWGFVFSEFWKIQDDILWDEWSDRVIDLLPEYIYELDHYDGDEFSWLDENGFNRLKSLYDGMSEQWAQILRDIVDMEEVYAYSSIPGTGKESIRLLNKVIDVLEGEGIGLPGPQSVAFSTFDQFNGRGDSFSGRNLSLIVPSR